MKIGINYKWAFLLSLWGAPVNADIMNPDFDSSTSGWKFFMDAGAGGLFQWNDSVGSPTIGSAQVGNNYIGERRDSWGQCIALHSGTVTLNTQVKSVLKENNHCELKIVAVDKADCATGAGILAETQTVNSQTDNSFENMQVTLNVPAGAQSAVVFLSHLRSATAVAGASDCYFDHIELLGDALFYSGFEN